MITLIFLLFISMNAGLTYSNYSNAPDIDLVNEPTEEVLSVWGAPDRIVAAADLGLASSQLAAVEIWSYDSPERSVVVRNNIVVSIRVG
jgi:hypothetical protein